MVWVVVVMIWVVVLMVCGFCVAGLMIVVVRCLIVL